MHGAHCLTLALGWDHAVQSHLSPMTARGSWIMLMDGWTHCTSCALRSSVRLLLLSLQGQLPANGDEDCWWMLNMA